MIMDSVTSTVQLVIFDSEILNHYSIAEGDDRLV
jgi:hypothetical protein